MATTINAPVKAQGNVTYPKLRVILDSLQFTLDSLITGTIAASRAVVTDASGLLTTSTTTSTEIGYVNGVTSAIQTQLNAKYGSGSTILAATGNTSAPGLSFASQTSSGFFYSAAPHKVSLSITGELEAAFALGAISLYGQVLVRKEPSVPTNASLGLISPNGSLGYLNLVPIDNAGDYEIRITNQSHSAARVYTLEDVGANAFFVMTAGTQSIAGQKTFTTSPLGLSISTAGSTVTFNLQQTNNSNAASHATTTIETGGASGGDPWLRFFNNVVNYSLGIDNSDSDLLCLTAASTLNGTNLWKATTAGEITQPLQPSFLATISADQTDCTGDSTGFTVPFGTEIYDQGSDFASNTFTAPVTGRYFLSAAIRPENLLVTHTIRRISIVTSNRAYSVTHNYSLAQTNLTLAHSVIADMDAGDTATIELMVDGSTKTVDLTNNPAVNFFSGSLIN